eukprot:3655215-Prymnesium_polylepis.1
MAEASGSPPPPRVYRIRCHEAHDWRCGSPLTRTSTQSRTQHKARVAPAHTRVGQKPPTVQPPCSHTDSARLHLQRGWSRIRSA